MKKRNIPAVLGGEPAFRSPVPVMQPTLPEPRLFLKHLRKIFRSHIITDGSYTRKLENSFSRYLKGRECVAVSSCTSGLILALQALKEKHPGKKKVLLPSFTFMATAHAVVWNGLEPVFVDCDESTFCVDVKSVEESMSDKVLAVLGVYLFGNSPDFPPLLRLCRNHEVFLVMDAAHALGGHAQNLPAGAIADVEVFSLSPTKIVTAGEGGMVTTADSSVAETVRTLREYGHKGDYNSLNTGLSARLSELHALLGFFSFSKLSSSLKQRARLVSIYKKRLSSVPGVSFQKIHPGCIHNNSIFTVKIHPESGLSRDVLCRALLTENIQVKKYFAPPVHRQKAYKHLRHKPLPHTDELSACLLSFPLFSHMMPSHVHKVCSTTERIFTHARAVQKKFY